MINASQHDIVRPNRLNDYCLFCLRLFYACPVCNHVKRFSAGKKRRIENVDASQRNNVWTRLTHSCRHVVIRLACGKKKNSSFPFMDHFLCRFSGSGSTDGRRATLIIFTFGWACNAISCLLRTTDGRLDFEPKPRALARSRKVNDDATPDCAPSASGGVWRRKWDDRRRKDLKIRNWLAPFKNLTMTTHAGISLPMNQVRFKDPWVCETDTNNTCWWKKKEPPTKMTSSDMNDNIQTREISPPIPFFFPPPTSLSNHEWHGES